MSTLVDVAATLSRDVEALGFGAPVSTVYNPLSYAWQAHKTYLDRYGRGDKEILIIGMNPGPFGMVQTGVPFGDVTMVREWLGIEGGVGRPAREHPRRPIEGFACRRGEVSGRRLWGWLRTRFGDPARMAERLLVANYCPLAFLEESGRNRTPDKLPIVERTALLAACDRALRAMIAATHARTVIGVGQFAAERLRIATTDLDVGVAQILHPSPASPAANRGWEAQVEVQLRALGIDL